MAKPTMIQSLLGRPSQSYSHPSKKDYHSTKPLMVKIAVEAQTNGGDTTQESNGPINNKPERRRRRPEEPAVTDSQHMHPQHSDSDDSSSASGGEIYFTPPTSPRASRALSTASMHSSIKFAPASRRRHLTGPNGSTTSLSSSIATITEGDPTVISGPPSQSTPSTASGPAARQKPSTPESSGPRLRRVSRQPVPATDKDWAKEIRRLIPPASYPSKDPAKVKTGRPASVPVAKPKTTITFVPIQPPSSSSSSTTTSPTSPSPAHAKQVPKSSVAPNAQQRTKVATAPSSIAMAAVLEEPDETSTIGSRKVPNGVTVEPRTPGPSPTKTHRARHLSKPPPSRASSTTTSTTTSARTPTRTQPPELPSKGTQGYTSLTLARAPPPTTLKGTGRAGVSGYVDLTRSGVAQTTMATVEVVRGMADSAPTPATGLARLASFGKGTLKKRSKHGHRNRDEGGMSFTSYRSPPNYVPSGSVLVQVWAVGLDVVDWRMGRTKLGLPTLTTPPPEKKASNGGKAVLGRTGSMRSILSLGLSRSASNRSKDDLGTQSDQEGKRKKEKEKEKEKDKDKDKKPDLGFIPGRAFVGRVLEYGWQVRETEGGRRGEWVVGLGEVRKCGALAEFVVVDRRRIHVVELPYFPPRPSLTHGSSSSMSRSRSPSPTPSASTATPLPPTLSELALVPLCGLPAWRAVRTFETGRGGQGRRVLVLGGESGVGGLAGRMLTARGWRVVTWVSSEPEGTPRADGIAERLQGWGCEEVLYSRTARHTPVDGDGAPVEEDERTGAVRILERLIRFGELFDGVLDCVGGKEVWEGAERLLLLAEEYDAEGEPMARQFTTLFGDNPGRPVPSASDLYKASMRSRTGGQRSRYPSERSYSGGGTVLTKDKGKGKGKAKVVGNIGYVWVSVTTDVDWDGEDVRGSIACMLAERQKCAIEGDGSLFVEGVGDVQVIPFEKSAELFGWKEEDQSFRGGGAMVVKIAQ